MRRTTSTQPLPSSSGVPQAPQHRSLLSVHAPSPPPLSFFFFNDPAPPEIYPFSLHDALPISSREDRHELTPRELEVLKLLVRGLTNREIAKVLGNSENTVRNHTIRIFAKLYVSDRAEADRKSTRLNSSHGYISYAVFCLKKKK